MTAATAPPEGVDDAARVRALQALGVSFTEPEERFDRITRLARRLFGVSVATVSLIDGDTQWYKSRQGLDVASIPRSVAFCDQTIRRSDSLVVEDMTLDDRFRDHPFVGGDTGARFYAGHPLDASGGHHVGTLCLIDREPRTFGPAQRRLLQELAELAESELRHSAEMQHAAEVQQSLVPRREAELPGYEFAAMCLPARAVGGDFIDWWPRPDGGISLTLADVMGKGLGAAIMMATVRAAMRTAGRVGRPAEAVRRAAAALDDDLQQTGTLVTMLHARLEGDRYTWTDAGHGLHVVIRADGTVEHVGGSGLPLGTLSDDRWTEQSVTVHPGDFLIAFSDGLLALFDESLDAAVAEVERVVRAGADAAALVAHLDAIARSTPLPDDVTVVVARRLPGPVPAPAAR